MSLIILSYNIKMLNPLIFSSRQVDRAQLIGRVIREQLDFVDVVVFQELFDDNAEDEMDRQLKHYHKSKKVGDKEAKAMTGLFKGKLDDGGVKIYSKHPILNQKLITYDKSSKDDALAHKGAIRVKINKKGKDFYIIGTHIQSGKKEKEVNIKYTQFQQIKESLIEGIEDKPYWIVGDFNIDFHKQKKVLGRVLNITNTGISQLLSSNFDTSGGDTDMLRVDGSTPAPKLLDFGIYAKNGTIRSNHKKVISIISQQGIKLPKETKKKGSVFGRVFSKKNKILINDLSDHRPVLIHGRLVDCQCPLIINKKPNTYADTRGVIKRTGFLGIGGVIDIEQTKREIIEGGAQTGLDIFRGGQKVVGKTSKSVRKKAKKVKRFFS